MFHYCVFHTNVERSTPLATVRFVELSRFESVSFQLRLVSCATRQPSLTLHVPKLSVISRISVVVHVSRHSVDGKL